MDSDNGDDESEKGEYDPNKRVASSPAELNLVIPSTSSDDKCVRPFLPNKAYGRWNTGLFVLLPKCDLNFSDVLT